MDAADRLFGEIAVELGYLSREGLAACVRTHYDSPVGTDMGAIALSLGLMQQPEIDAVRQAQERVGDRRKPKGRAGVVEIDATLGGSSEERGEARSLSAGRLASVRAPSRDAMPVAPQPAVAAAYRAPSSPKIPAAGTARRAPDRTLIGPGSPKSKKAESTPSHEAITIAPPPPSTGTPDYSTGYDASDDPEVSFETDAAASPPAARAAAPRPASAANMAPAGVGFRRRTTPPQPDAPTARGAATQDDTEVNFGSLLSMPPAPSGEAKRVPLGGTVHGVGAPTPTTAQKPAAAAMAQPRPGAKAPTAPELPSMPPMASATPTMTTPPHGVSSGRPRSGTLEFASSVAPAEPPPVKTGSKPPRKPSGTIQHFRAVTPPTTDDANARATTVPKPGQLGWEIDNAQPLVVQSPAPTVRRPSARPPRRASAWFSSRPSLDSDRNPHTTGLGSRADVATADVKDAALALLPPGNEALLFRALRAALDRGAHDLHMHRAAPIMMRLNGNMQPLFGGTPLGERAVEKALAQIMSDAQWQTLNEVGETTFSVELPDTGRTRVSAYRSDAGCDAVLRVTPSQPRSLTDLGLPTSLAKLLDYEAGLIVCTGPTGSGVTSTIGALLADVVTSRQAHVVTIEETIELRMPATRSMVSQRQLGLHVDDMRRAVRAIAHEDVDLVAIGDLRHPGDVALALSLAHGGHLVLAGAHARGAADCVNRLLRPFGKHDQGQARTMVAQSLRAVVSQELVMRADGKGRVPAIELIVATPAICDMIRRGAPLDIESLTASGKAQKLVTLADSLKRLVAAGTVTSAEAERVTNNRMRQA